MRLRTARPAPRLGAGPGRRLPDPGGLPRSRLGPRRAISHARAAPGHPSRRPHRRPGPAGRAREPRRHHLVRDRRHARVRGRRPIARTLPRGLHARSGAARVERRRIHRHRHGGGPGGQARGERRPQREGRRRAPRSARQRVRCGAPHPEGHGQSAPPRHGEGRLHLDAVPDPRGAPADADAVGGHDRRRADRLLPPVARGERRARAALAPGRGGDPLRVAPRAGGPDPPGDSHRGRATTRPGERAHDDAGRGARRRPVDTAVRGPAWRPGRHGGVDPGARGRVRGRGPAPLHAARRAGRRARPRPPSPGVRPRSCRPRDRRNAQTSC